MKYLDENGLARLWTKIKGYVSWNNISSKPSTFPPSSHTHDDRYYTETEVNNLLADYVPKSKIWKTLWSGSWSSGTITVPNTDDYNFFIVTFSGQGSVVPVFKWGTHIRGIGGYDEGAANSRHDTHAFTATFSGNVWTFVSATFTKHNFSNNHGPKNSMTVTSIIGVI